METPPPLYTIQKIGLNYFFFFETPPVFYFLRLNKSSQKIQKLVKFMDNVSFDIIKYKDSNFLY